MFGQFRSAAATYAQVGVETSVQTATPHQLIALLFEGARSALSLARIAMDENNVEARGSAVSKAINIIANGLQASLDMGQGDLSEKLNALYDYMVRRLTHANIRNDRQALEEVDGLLKEIQEAWVGIATEVHTAPATEGA